MNQRVCAGLKPERVFYYFEEICGMPHGSGNTKQISDYCVEFAKKHQLKVVQDEWNNCIIWKDAGNGRENDATVIIQGHLDMVTEQTADCKKNMETEGLDLAIDGDFLYAKDTTLGGDDGIAIAYALAILEDDSISHPPLEVVFTVDEEVGMLGAKDIDISMLKGKYMLNLDSEEEHILLTGCAGGLSAIGTILVKSEEMTGQMVQLKVSGLTGGHSGVEIHKERANANIVLGRILKELMNHIPFFIHTMEGGNKDNAIVRDAVATICVPQQWCNSTGVIWNVGNAIETIQDNLSDVITHIKQEYQMTDPNMCISIKMADINLDAKNSTDINVSKSTAEINTTAKNLTEINIDEQESRYKCLTLEDSIKVIDYLYLVPNGVCSDSVHVQGLVETSLNLGIMRCDNEKMTVIHSIRSEVASRKQWVCGRVERLIHLLGGTMKVEGEYPEWTFKENSKLRPIMTKLYREMFGKEVQVETVHAGLECGYFLQKKPDLDVVSFGPDIYDIHTTEEKISISSVERMYRYILAILEQIH